MRIPLIAATALFATAAFAQGSAAPPADLPPGAGQAQVVAACSGCHAMTVVTGQHHTAAQWDQIVEQMVSRGAPLADADYDVVVAYLAKNYGTTP